LAVQGLIGGWQQTWFQVAVSDAAGVEVTKRTQDLHNQEFGRALAQAAAGLKTKNPQIALNSC
jgi:hypothetical protein